LSELRSRFHITPQNTWNIDEKGFLLGVTSREKVICMSKRRSPRVILEGGREWITLLETISASGQTLPPFVVYKGEAQYMGWHNYVERDEATFALPPNGWTNNITGLKYLVEHFQPRTQPQDITQYRLLLVDGHGSHLTYEFAKFALENRIRILCFPAHSTHLLQPHNVGIFSPLGRYYGQEVDRQEPMDLTNDCTKGISSP
jgi:hypothetical protein